MRTLYYEVDTKKKKKRNYIEHRADTMVPIEGDKDGAKVVLSIKFEKDKLNEEDKRDVINLLKDIIFPQLIIHIG